MAPDIQDGNPPSKYGEIHYPKTLPAMNNAVIGEFGPTFQIDWRLCDGCALCTAVCPPDIIVIEDFKAIVPPENHPNCYECGSCMSVCMKNAIFRV